ncbi:MAG: QueT transporter family protein [Faecalicatena sp.]|uniref:QueT transporter family protein n=1 Tax=Faecalicatena sp. TaxID=2005360 RepID=UPI002587CEAE|nr:QueT transporter family protein [Faecalicatena sp.]MCI6465396.1 QueT transporter family protein [Faecalicatena sp.]MDY5617228.1 QueT transporter family protein [Lachnospiraceae bacterium]
MKNSGNNKVLFMAQAAMIAAIYVVLTIVFAPFSYGEVQVRISEALTILPVFTPAAIPGLFIGCIISNILGGCILPDIIFGSLATLIGAIFTWQLRNKSKFLAPLPPILANTIIVPFVLRYGYQVPLPIPFMMLTVGIGEVISCGVLGMIVYAALSRYKHAIFKTA